MPKVEERMQSVRLERKADCRRYLEISTSPPASSCVNMTISEHLSYLILHKNLQQLTLEKPRFEQGGGPFWASNGKSGARKLFRRHLLRCENLVELRYWYADFSKDSCNMIMIARLARYLPSLQLFSLWYSSLLPSEPIPSSLYFTMMVIPKKMKQIDIDGWFCAKFLTGCCQRRISSGFVAENINCQIKFLPESDQKLKVMFLFAEKQQLVKKLNVGRMDLKAALIKEIGEEGLKYLHTSTSIFLAQDYVWICYNR